MNLWRTLTRPFRAGPRRPLAQYRPERDPEAGIVPLGMEATDLAAVARVNRRNDALDRTNGHGTGLRRFGTRTQGSATHVAPMPEDETYAARYARAFQPKGDKT
jgi:hypothetical protein